MGHPDSSYPDVIGFDGRGQFLSPGDDQEQQEKVCQSKSKCNEQEGQMKWLLANVVIDRLLKLAAR